MALDVFHGGSISASTPTGKGTDDLKGVLGGSSNPHPRGSLFDDDVGAEEVSSSPVTHTSGGQGRNGHLVASDPIVSSPQRVVSSALCFGCVPQICFFFLRLCADFPRVG